VVVPGSNLERVEQGLGTTGSRGCAGGKRRHPRDVPTARFRAAMAKFLMLVGHKGPVPADFVDGAGPDPAMFGLPVQDDGSRDDPLLGQNIVSSTHYEPISMRSAKHRPGSSSPQAPNPRASWPVAGRSPLPNDSVQRPSCSRAATEGSSAMSMVTRVRPRLSPRHCVRCSPRRREWTVPCSELGPTATPCT
jgi:hypothetical protein